MEAASIFASWLTEEIWEWIVLVVPFPSFFSPAYFTS